jgi:chromosome partitioning protein
MPARGRLADEMISRLTSLGIGVAQATLGNRVAFAETLAEGAGVSEREPNSTATQEITAVGEELWARAAQPVA